MITSLTFTNLRPSTPDVITFNDHTYPVKVYEDPITSRHDSRPKVGSQGSWPVFQYDEYMEITIEGDILGDSSDDYTSKRYALTSCLRYRPSTPQRRNGRIDVLFDSVSEHVYADVIIASFDAARTSNNPSVTDFRLVLISFLPYYIGVTSGNPFYDS